MLGYTYKALCATVQDYTVYLRQGLEVQRVLGYTDEAWSANECEYRVFGRTSAQALQGRRIRTFYLLWVQKTHIIDKEAKRLIV